MSSGKRSARFRILNVSVTGAKLEGPLTLALHEGITIKFTFEGATCEVAAEVVRVDTPDLMTDEIAARFLEPSAEVHAALERIVHHALTAPDPEATQEIEIEAED